MADDFFTCLICRFEFPLDLPIYQCVNGHVICANCEQKMYECGLCKQPLGKNPKIRNLSVQHFRDALFPCSNESRGCTHRFLTAENRDLHEPVCELRVNPALESQQGASSQDAGYESGPGESGIRSIPQWFIDQTKSRIADRPWFSLVSGGSAAASANEPVPSTSAAARAAASANKPVPSTSAAARAAASANEPVPSTSAAARAAAERRAASLLAFAEVAEFDESDTDTEMVPAPNHGLANEDEVPEDAEMVPAPNHGLANEDEVPEDAEMDVAEDDLGNEEAEDQGQGVEHGYPCQECDFVARAPSYLREHSRTHTGETPYHCEHCPYQGKRQAALNRHIDSVHRHLKPHRCNQNRCTYSAAQKSNLKRHLATVHGVYE